MNAANCRQRLLRRQRGLAMVEFTLSAPILLLLLFGAVEFGRFLIQYSVLNDSVRNAARYVSGKALEGTNQQLLQGTAWTTLVSQGKNLAVAGDIAGTGAALLPSLTVAQISVTPDAVNNTITVTAAYPYQALFGASMPNFMGGTVSTTFTLSISTSMRAL
jgi:Flp pilus assembly protein TadG